MQVATLRAKYAALVPVLTERSRRVWAAAEARAIGYGGIALVTRATGIAESTIQRGLRDLDAREPLPAPAVVGRAVGGSGRPRPTPRCCATWTPWCNRRRRAIPSRHSGGRARARGRWRWPWRDWGITSATR